MSDETQGRESLFDARHLEGVEEPCDGSDDCRAMRHVHGCFSDFGNCDDPGAHRCHCERPCVGPGIYPSCLDCGGQIGG